jgi:hypothetical protein
MPVATSHPCVRRLLLAAAVALAVVPRARASGPVWVTPSDLRRISVEQLDQVFAEGRAECLPVGAFHGTVLLRTDTRLPRLRARLAGIAWKGKVFDPDGGFTNQWAGFRAVASRVAVGSSWYDGRPCVVLEYPPSSPVFANARDELREIAPGVYLGRFYERCPCPRLQGYFVLEMISAKGCPPADPLSQHD